MPWRGKSLPQEAYRPGGLAGIQVAVWRGARGRDRISNAVSWSKEGFCVWNLAEGLQR